MTRKYLIIIILTIFVNLNAQNKFDKYFKDCNVSGSTTIYDYKNKKWFFSDSLDAKKKTLPASTFKILNSLIALETKVIKDENEIIKWDKKDKKFFGESMEVWNKDTNLKDAYKNSTIWFYVELAKKIRKNRYHKYIDKINYGNGDIENSGEDFWNYGNFGISPFEQVEFLVKLYENKLPFSQENIQKVKDIMISEKTEKEIFRDKTGWTRKDGEDIGWYVGYAEISNNVYFFATRITENVYPENPNFGKCRMSITRKIMNDLIERR